MQNMIQSFTRKYMSSVWEGYPLTADIPNTMLVSALTLSVNDADSNTLIVLANTGQLHLVANDIFRVTYPGGGNSYEMNTQCLSTMGFLVLNMHSSIY